jgi:hypothetical protein
MTDEHEEKRFFYFVDDQRYESDLPALTGAQIKAKIPNLNPTFALVLEGHGNRPNRIIGDDELVQLDSDHGPLRFILVPPANFGRQ